MILSLTMDFMGTDSTGFTVAAFMDADMAATGAAALEGDFMGVAAVLEEDFMVEEEVADEVYYCPLGGPC
jgi:hypothetical protein